MHNPIVNEINVRHFLYLDLLADQCEVERFGDSFPFDDQADLRSRFAAGKHADFVRLLGSHFYPIDLEKPVSRLDSIRRALTAWIPPSAVAWAT